MSGVRPYIVRQGDYVAKIAAQLGCSEDEIWGHEKNKELKESGRTKGVLNPGDVLHVQTSEGRGGRVTLGATQSFKAIVPAVRVNLVFRDAEGPLANRSYAVLDAGSEIRGSTDGNGAVFFSVSPYIGFVRVVFDDPFAIHLIAIGHIDPVTERSGVVGRLSALGYITAEAADSVSAERLRVAIAAFQRDRGLPETGVLDDDGLGKLETEFGS